MINKEAEWLRKIDDIYREADAQNESISHLRLELENLKRKADELTAETTQYRSGNSDDSLIQNLENQIDCLREEVKFESALRSRIEKELSLTIEELNICKLSTNNVSCVKEGQKSCEVLYSQNHSPSPETRSKLEQGDNPVTNTVVELAELRLLYDDATRTISELTEKCTNVQDKYQASRQMTEEAVEKVKELVELVAKVSNERDTAQDAQSQATAELVQLRQVINRLVDESGQRIREEVEKVREQANENIRKLLEELHNAEKDKVQLAMELEYAQSGFKSQNSNGIFNAKETQREEMQQETYRKRLVEIEEERETLKLQLDSLKNSHERMTMTKQNEIQQLTEQNQFLEERCKTLESQLNTCQDKLQIKSDTLNKTEIEINKIRAQMDLCQRNALHQVMLAQQAVEMHDMETKQRIQNMERMELASGNKWRDLLNKQQNLATQWRSEAERLASQIEKQNDAFRSELNKYRKRVDELTRALSSGDRTV